MFWYWLFVYTTWAFIKPLYGFRVYGKTHIPDSGVILAPNHVSYLDPFIISVAIHPKDSHYFAHATFFNNSFLRFFLTRLQTHPVYGSIRDLESLKLMQQLLKSKKNVLIFPEGTRSHTGELQPLKAGVARLALRTGSAIIPIYIHGADKVWPPHRSTPKLSGQIACVIGQPLPMQEAAALPAKEGAAHLNQQLEQALLDLRSWYEKGAIGDPP